MDKKNLDVSIVVPFYNEAESVDIFFKKIIPILKKSGYLFEILCINDGSTDSTLEQLIKIKEKHNEIGRAHV